MSAAKMANPNDLMEKKRKARIDGYRKKLLDADVSDQTRKEFETQFDSLLSDKDKLRGFDNKDYEYFDSLGKELDNAIGGKGKYKNRKFHEEQASLMRNSPGATQQTLMTGGPNKKNNVLLGGGTGDR